MSMKWVSGSLSRAFVLALATVATAPTASLAAGDIDWTRLKNADSEPQNWFTGGRDKDGTYYSPLTLINDKNVDKLGFAWAGDLGTARAQEATPIVVDGVMYASGTWGYVYAVNAATGKELWRYDPDVPGQVGRNPCCDVVNRGVAVFKGKVYVASLDGRLHALDAATGKQIWEVDTIVDHSLTYASTGAPQIAKNVVMIGNAGGDMDFGGVRGYVTAYDLETGQQKWRFFTVPPAPGQPLENPELAIAEKTWDPNRGPIYKGGATVWDGFSYDPDLNLVYFGTGNAAPYDARQLGPKNGDDLFAASIVAVNPDTGRMSWYYQTTPGDHWDYDAVQKMVLANVKIDGKPQRVLMQANKNGFFYVLNAKSGKLLSAKNFSFINWATKVDMKTGRPVLAPASNWYDKPSNVYPSWAGAHTWPPMSYNLKTGLVYIPVVDVPSVWVDMAHNGGSVKYLNGFFSANGVITDDSYDAESMKELFGHMPSLQELKAAHKGKLTRELIRAWDPIKQKPVWEHETSSGMRNYDGGIMSTAGNLVFQGRGSGELWVYAADTGKVLKTIQTGNHIMSAPMTYAVDGVQYVAVQVGYGGTAMATSAIQPSSAALKYENTNRIITFKLGGGEVPTPAPRVDPDFPKPPEQTASVEQIKHGEVKFTEQCVRCHMFGPSITPDLRKLTPETHAEFKNILLHGARSANGMGNFSDLLSESDVEDIHAYLIEQERQGYAEQQAAKK
jgi:quinohemoprotein ethanol dehydrogenase